jgi:aspartate 1-decarboxylase
MYRTMLKSKVHRATVTQSDLHYVGSLTIDAAIMAAADLLPGEQVDVVDIDNGARLTTYVIEGERGSGIIGINGAAARLVSPGDLVIIISYAMLDPAEIAQHCPRVVFVDRQNRMLRTGGDLAEPHEAGAADGLVRGDVVRR